MSVQNELFLLIEQGSLKQIKDCISQLQNDEINTQNKQGQTPLQMAVKNGDEEIVRLLVSSGSDINKTNFSGQTPLFLACWNNQAKMVQLLIQLGSNLNLQDNVITSIDIPVERMDSIDDKRLQRARVNMELTLGLKTLQNIRNLSSKFGKKPIDRAKNQQVIQMLQQTADEMNLASLPINSHSPQKAKARQQTEEETSNRSKPRNPSAGYVNVKTVENQNQLRQMSSQLATQSKTILTNAINNYLDQALQKQILVYQQQVMNELYVKFEERMYHSFDCLTEYLQLKLKISLAHMGVKSPEIDAPKVDVSKFQKGFIQMISLENQKLMSNIDALNQKQQYNEKQVTDQIKKLESENSIVGQHLENSFQETCKRLFEESQQRIDGKISEECGLIERRVEDKLENMLEKMEQEMKKRVDELVVSYTGEVKNQLDEVDRWIQKKEKNQKPQQQQPRIQSLEQTKSPSFNNSERGSLQNIFQQQNLALKEKISQLKSTLSKDQERQF